MIHNLDKIDIVGYSNKLLAEIQSKQLLSGIVTKHDCRGKSSIQVADSRALDINKKCDDLLPTVDKHVIDRLSDFGGSVRMVTITTQNWEAGTYIDYFLLDDVNFDYKTLVQDRGLPDAIAMAADQVVIDALNVDTHMKEFPYDAGKQLVDLFADCKFALDGAIDDNPPIAGRKLILPVAAKKAMYYDEKFMNSPYVQHQMNDIMSGKAGKFLGFDTLFIPNRKRGGLMYELQADGKRMYTCYAVCPGAVHSAEGYGGDRVLNNGGIMKVDDIPHKGCIFVYVPYQAGAKVVMPQRVVRFYMVTDAV